MTAERTRFGWMADPARPWLRGASFGDQDMLRCWRNEHAHRFFDRRQVTIESQQRWFEGYLARPEDFLFMVMAGEQAVGCIGIRFRNESWDLYNVIRGVSLAGTTGFMSQALTAVIAFARGRRAVPVRADVLSDNPALGWYCRNGFVRVGEAGQSVSLSHRGEPRV